MPHGYFDRETAAELDQFRRQTLRDRNTRVSLHFPEAEEKLTHAWHESAVSFVHKLAVIPRRASAYG